MGGGSADRPPRLPLVVDFHVHMLDEAVFGTASPHCVSSGFGRFQVQSSRPGVAERLKRMFDPAAQVEDMDARGIDMNVVTSSTVIQGTSWAEAADDLKLCRRCNDVTAEWVARFPDRFIGSMVLPLQDVGLALAELERCTGELGLRVANVSSNYRGAYMGAPVFEPFWKAVRERDLTVWIHPEGVRDEWFQDYALWNSAGQSIEEAKVMASLIYEGVMARHEGVKVVMAHGGGYFPHYMGRLDRNAGNRPDTLKNTGGRKPSDFLRSFYYDTCVYDPLVLRTLLERVGADRLVLGSDYPVGEHDPVGFLEKCGVAGRDLADIAGGTAARLLGLPATRSPARAA
jgi:aminocarboxymuconate-semialdehyde decarboxylase